MKITILTENCAGSKHNDFQTQQIIEFQFKKNK